jgi:hypothetical protein
MFHLMSLLGQFPRGGWTGSTDGLFLAWLAWQADLVLPAGEIRILLIFFLASLARVHPHKIKCSVICSSHRWLGDIILTFPILCEAHVWGTPLSKDAPQFFL